MRYLMTIAYDGSHYSGYQKQPRMVTIQGELEKVLTKINSEKKVTVSASGRTDAGVHAYGQRAHFDLKKDWDLYKLQGSLNSLLPKDIYVRRIEKVADDFHARFDVQAKEYIYKLNMGEYNPLEKDYVYQYNEPLKVVEMERALKYLEGTHNFQSFTKADEEKEDYVRTILETRIVRDKKDINQITISITGSGFLRYMVRNIVGFLIEVGEGKRKSQDILTVLEAQDRTQAGITAPACGLYLNQVFY